MLEATIERCTMKVMGLSEIVGDRTKDGGGTKDTSAREDEMPQKTRSPRVETSPRPQNRRHPTTRKHALPSVVFARPKAAGAQTRPKAASLATSAER